ncbi:MAG: hypothetical protein ACR2QE_11185, partial [Acidimicrobiales bacterium]
PVDARLPRFGAPITARFGAPLDLGRWAGARPTAVTNRQITASLMRAIAALSDQRVDTTPTAPTRPIPATVPASPLSVPE